MMDNLFYIGLLFGMRHAFEGDHLAAVSTLATEQTGLKHSVNTGLFWGIGHTIMLVLVSSAFLYQGNSIPELISPLLEWIVGVMLLLLGIDVVYRAIKTRKLSSVAQSTSQARTDTLSRKESKTNQLSYPHHPKFPVRAFVVGLIHGLAGSAAIVLLLLSKAGSKSSGFGFIIQFGIGSMIGMMLFCFLIAVSLLKIRTINGAFPVICCLIGLLTLLTGLMLLMENSTILLTII